MRQTSRFAILFAMFLVVATSSAADVTIKDYNRHKDDPALKQEIDSYFLGAVNAWVFANDTVSSVTGKKLFCVDEDHQHLSVKSVRALFEARIATEKFYKEHPESELHPIIFETLVNNFHCGNLTFFPTMSSAPEPTADHSTIFSALDASIPNWKIVNEQAGFLAWLNRYDTSTGETRQKTLMAAYNANDSHTVVRIFHAYLQEKPPSH